MLRRFIGANRWAILLTLLLLSMLLEAIIAQSIGRTLVAEVGALLIGVAIMVGLVYAVDHPAFVDWIVLSVLLLFTGLGIANAFNSAAWIDRGLLSISSLMLIGGLVITFFQLIQPMRSDREKLFSAVFGYFLIAMLWAYLYWRIDQVAPGAMNFPEDGANDGTVYLYFSLVTLSTLGYGDIAPALAVPRFLAALEASFGTLYVAVLIGQIVGRFR